MLKRGDFGKGETHCGTGGTGSIPETDEIFGDLKDSVSAKDDGRDVDPEGAKDDRDALDWGVVRVETVLSRAWDD